MFAAEAAGAWAPSSMAQAESITASATIKTRISSPRLLTDWRIVLPNHSACQLPDYPGTAPRVLPSAEHAAVQDAGLQRLPLLAITWAHTLKSRHIGHA